MLIFAFLFPAQFLITKQGLKMLDAVYERLNHNSKRKITQKIIDLKDEQGNARGTRIEIIVPGNANSDSH